MEMLMRFIAVYPESGPCGETSNQNSTHDDPENPRAHGYEMDCDVTQS